MSHLNDLMTRINELLELTESYRATITEQRAELLFVNTYMEKAQQEIERLRKELGR